MDNIDTHLPESSVLNTAVVAHKARADMAYRLADEVNASHISMDDGTLGCEGNHKQVWQWHIDNTHQPWSVIVEDDAVPVAAFPVHASHALQAAPGNIVSFYLGKHVRTTSLDKRKRRAITEAKRINAHWILGNKLLHAVAVAVRTPLIPHMLQAVHELPPMLPIDQAITAWAIGNNEPVCYTWPSLADHADKPTLFKHYDGLDRPPGRVAYQIGTNTAWTRTAVKM